jgi:thioredoxin-like negative regulator of GroEL
MYTFQGTPISTASPIIVYSFHARWCGTCRGVRRALEVFETSSPVPVVEVDVEAFQTFSNLYNVQGVPVLILLRDGREIARRSGSTTLEELRDWMTQSLS